MAIVGIARTLIIWCTCPVSGWTAGPGKYGIRKQAIQSNSECKTKGNLLQYLHEITPKSLSFTMAVRTAFLADNNLLGYQATVPGFYIYVNTNTRAHITE